MTAQHCRECGASYVSRRDKPGNVFCCTGCRDSFNNRRKARGAQLYDLFMIVRYERGLAKARGIWTLLCRLAQEWREEDHRERGGRQSWRDYDALHDGLLPLRAEVLGGTLNTARAATENRLSAASLRA